MEAQLPSWLDASPAQFAQAAQAGRRSTDEEAQIGIDAQRVQNQAMQAAQAAQMESARLRADTTTKMLQLNLQRDQMNKDNQVSMQKVQVAHQLGQMRLEGATKVAAMKLQQQTMYQSNYNENIRAGMTPEEAAKAAMWKTGFAPTGMADVMKAQSQPARGTQWQIDPTNPKMLRGSNGDVKVNPMFKGGDDHKTRSEYMKMFLEANKDNPQYRPGRKPETDKDGKTITPPDIMKDAVAFADEQVGGSKQGGGSDGGSEKKLYPTQEDIKMLKESPNLARFFDEKFGEGESAKYIDGDKRKEYQQDEE